MSSAKMAVKGTSSFAAVHFSRTATQRPTISRTVERDDTANALLAGLLDRVVGCFLKRFTEVLDAMRDGHSGRAPDKIVAVARPGDAQRMPSGEAPHLAPRLLHPPRRRGLLLCPEAGAHVRRVADAPDELVRAATRRCERRYAPAHVECHRADRGTGEHARVTDMGEKRQADTSSGGRDLGVRCWGLGQHQRGFQFVLSSSVKHGAPSIVDTAAVTASMASPHMRTPIERTTAPPVLRIL